MSELGKLEDLPQEYRDASSLECPLAVFTTG